MHTDELAGYFEAETAPAIPDKIKKAAEFLVDGIEAGDMPPSSPNQERKRSTVVGEAQEKIIAALTLHHEYQDESCLNLEPIGGNELARKAKTGKGSVSRFFKKQFGGHGQYRAACRDKVKLAASLRLLNDEFAPKHLFGKTPPTEGRDADDE